jgi:RNA polymerase sigma-70 factor (ECF subfamily)
VTAGEDKIGQEIVARAVEGDRKAFGVIVESTKTPLHAFIRRYVGDADEAYDILQNSFVAAWLGMPRFDPARPILPWLRTIALNKCRDHARRAAVRRLFLRARAEEAPEPVDYERADSDIKLARLDRAIVQLPLFYREPLLLVLVSGLSHAEAAQILNTTPKAVEMRLRRARQRLGALLDESPEG